MGRGGQQSYLQFLVFWRGELCDCTPRYFLVPIFLIFLIFPLNNLNVLLKLYRTFTYLAY
jgi:hypothetical protein